MAKEGVIGLWRGNTPNVLKVIPRSALQFAVFDNMKARLYVHVIYPRHLVKWTIRYD